MFVADALEQLTVAFVQVDSQTSLAETARAMAAGNAAAVLVVDQDRCRGVVTATDMLRALATSSTIELGWQSEVATVMSGETSPISQKERLTTIFTLMRDTGRDYLPLSTGNGLTVLSLAKLLMLDNTLLRREVDHLQTYIEALHDAPND
jgi:CBS domain-containing protein